MQINQPNQINQNQGNVNNSNNSNNAVLEHGSSANQSIVGTSNKNAVESPKNTLYVKLKLICKLIWKLIWKCKLIWKWFIGLF